MALIDREDLLKTLDSYELTKWYHGDLITIIFDAPTVDAVEVVRCKDCVCSRELDGIEKLIYTERTLMCDLFNSAVAEDGFCSEGALYD